MAGVAIVGRDESERGVEVHAIVPIDETLDPASRVVERGEGPMRIVGSVLQSSEERFGERVVVADVRATERRKNPETA